MLFQQKKYLKVIVWFFVFILFFGVNNLFASNGNSSVAGKILLQVENHGEAWYVSPQTMTRHYLGRPKDAFALMRQLGVGIKNDDLEKIPVGNRNLTGEDADADGLSNIFEDSIGTDKDNSDSDSDGFSDKQEILDGYNPNGGGQLSLDSNFALKQRGKIFLQIEQHGEAWYVNPNDSKRYFLGRPVDAFNIMKALGLGIKNNDLRAIVVEDGAINEKTEDPIDNHKEKTIEIKDENLFQKFAKDEASYYDPDDFDAKKYFDVDIDNSYCVSEREKTLYLLYNEYRRSLNLSEVPLSKSLSYVAKIHALDIIENSPTKGECTGHSWSNEGNWSSCCYTLPNPGPGDRACGADKPREITNYQGDASENGMDTAPGKYDINFDPEKDFSLYAFGAQDLLDAWKGSKLHNDALTNSGKAHGEWKAVGVGIYLWNANMLFGYLDDEAGEPAYCSENNFAYCEKLTNLNLKDECYFEKAEYNHDRAICNEITQVEFRKDCHYYLILSDNGFYDCAGGYNTAENFNCRKEKTYDKEAVCDKLIFDTTLQENCYLESAELNKNIDYCYLIKDLEKLDKCFYGASLSSLNEQGCDQIKDIENRESCYREVGTRSKDVSVCAKITDDQIRNTCYHFTARELKDPKVCENIVDLSYCKEDMSESACEYYKNGGGKISCYNYACSVLTPTVKFNYPECEVDTDKRTEAIEFCNSLSLILAKDKCFVSKTDKLDDYRLCDYVSDIKIKDECYDLAAQDARDITLCNYISDDILKTRCKEYLK